MRLQKWLCTQRVPNLTGKTNLGKGQFRAIKNLLFTITNSPQENTIKFVLWFEIYFLVIESP